MKIVVVDVITSTMYNDTNTTSNSTYHEPYPDTARGRYFHSAHEFPITKLNNDAIWSYLPQPRSESSKC